MRKNLVLLLKLVLVISTLPSCSSCRNKGSESTSATNSSETAKEVKKSITIGISQEPDSLFIPFKEMMASEEIVRAGTYTLTNFDEKWRLVPRAAKEIPTKENGLLEMFVENGVEKMRTTWHIKDDYAWPDGTPLSADDFVFTYELYKDPKQEILDRTVVEKVERMESKDNGRTLVVHWKQPYAYYHGYRQHEALPKHLVEPIYKQAPDQLKKSQFGQAPALAGAYTIKEWVPGSHIIAQKNPKYRGAEQPNFQEIIWRIIPQTNTLESNLISGTVDAISPTGLSLEQALQFERRHKDQFNFFFADGLVWEHMDFNLDNPILKDVRVRQALAHGSDREGIVKTLFEGRQPVAHGTEPPKSLYHNDNIKKYPFDQAKARALLDQAGWVLPAGKTIREKNGQTLTLPLMTTSGNKTRERVEQFLQSQWRDIGVDVQIKNEPAKVFFGETMRRRKYEALAIYAWLKDPLQLSDTLWRCDNIPSAKNNFQGQNMPGWCNADVDKLLNQASREMNEAERIKLGRLVEEKFAQELPSLPLYFWVEVSVTKKGLKNWKPTGTLQPVSWNASEWAWN